MTLTIRHRLFACLVALGVALAVTAAEGTLALRSANIRMNSVIVDRVQPLRQLKIVSDMYAVNIVDTAHKAHAGTITNKAALDNIAAAEKAVNENWTAYIGTTLTPHEKELVTETLARFPAANATVARLKQILQANDQAALAAFTANELYPTIDPLTGQINLLIDLQIQVSLEEGQASAKAYATTLWIMAGIALAAAAVLAASVNIIARKVTTPLSRMTDVMRQLAAGRLETAVPELGRADEIGAMAGAVQVFKEAGLEKRRLEAEAAEARATIEAEKAREEAHRREEARKQAQVVHALAEGLDKLSAGDLAFRVEDSFAPEYDKLRVDFNAAMGSLEDAMLVVNQAAAGIRGGSMELSKAADDMARRTEQQAASLEETAAALDQITATIQRSVSSIGQANKAVAGAKSDAERSERIVSRAVEAMGGIEGSSRQISQIIGVIDEIAFQTNLLALNAGVEAARAGESGRGFAVVAQEVRALAQRSAEAAKEIKGLITSSASQVDLGVELVRETGQALETIISRIDGIAAQVTDVAASAQEQSTGLNQINAAVNQMDQATQQNAAMVEQSATASGSLAREADSLAVLMGRFRFADPSGASRKAA
ncbi:HAMP domain-containing methyl-accepting chemotaxis protein [Caulobacter sp. BP25]|uniref:HAMP domain-containing methyl-accepting chemotaxis protein n=1 Tax=Caulobacter sp. BP25 TaxID=2048900 RepID=UPI000C12AAA5|nr:HAMP domain-containing methyl-accepting chemotaxis protein [Caulobacter sp. BP25]PHY17238.1 methyl-accepting chemotaxis protein [Caulobacter sp. BP25]